MPQNPRPPKTIWMGFVFLTAIVALAIGISLYQASRAQPPPPVLNPVAAFTLTNQEDNVVTLAALTNHVWIADIIFTRCASSCPVMTAQMKTLQDSLPSDSDARLVTLTTDPDYDSPAVLKKYGQRTGADFSRWTFLTGSKKEIAGLATDSLKLGSTPVPPGEQTSSVDLFVHSTIFVVVDKHARLRGTFQTEGEGVDWNRSEKSKLLATVRQLEREP